MVHLNNRYLPFQPGGVYILASPFPPLKFFPVFFCGHLNFIKVFHSVFYHSSLFSSFSPVSLPFFKSSFKFFPVFQFRQKIGGKCPEYISLHVCLLLKASCLTVMAPRWSEKGREGKVETRRKIIFAMDQERICFKHCLLFYHLVFKQALLSLLLTPSFASTGVYFPTPYCFIFLTRYCLFYWIHTWQHP